MKVISLCNSKGGVGKTTTAVHIGAALAKNNFKVLLIDLDANRSMTGFFKIDLESKKDPITAIDVIAKPERYLFSESAFEVDKNLFVAPNKNREVSLYERIFSDDPESIYNLKTALYYVKDEYDYVLIDTPGSSTSVYIPMAIATSDTVLVPIGQSDMDIEPTMTFLNILDEVIEKYNQDLHDVRFVPTKLKTKSQKNNIKKMFDEDLASKICESSITHRVIFERTSTKGLTIIQFDENNKGSKEYLKLAEEVM